MPQIVDIIANENACYKRNELEFMFYVRLPPFVILWLNYYFFNMQSVY